MTSESPSVPDPLTAARVIGSAGPWLAAASLWLWAGSAARPALFLAAALLVAGLLAEPLVRNRWRAAGMIVVVAGILVGFVAERQIAEVIHDWDGYWTTRVDEIGELLSGELDRRQAQGEAAADALMAADPDGFDGSVVAALRQRYGSQALALYRPGPDSSGTLVAWDGTHRGKVPESVQRGERRQAYRDLPLFGYLYLSSRGEDGSVAVAAYLLRAALPEGLGADMRDLASRFHAETGERIRITEEDPGLADAVWDLALDDENRLLSVVLERPARDDSWRFPGHSSIGRRLPRRCHCSRRPSGFP